MVNARHQTHRSAFRWFNKATAKAITLESTHRINNSGSHCMAHLIQESTRRTYRNTLMALRPITHKDIMEIDNLPSTRTMELTAMAVHRDTHQRKENMWACSHLLGHRFISQGSMRIRCAALTPIHFGRHRETKSNSRFLEQHLAPVLN